MACTVEKNNQLFPAVVAGDAAARDAMIEGNMALVVVKADALIRRMPTVAYLRDDLVSAGHVGLVKAVDKAVKGRIRSMKALNAYIGRCVTREMLELLPRERSIHVPRKSCDAARKNDHPIQAPVVLNMVPEWLQAHSQLAVVALRDTLDACCKSPTERECLRLREAGHTFQEIADALAMPLTTVYGLFRVLRDRVFAALAS
jgi:DNA-directed RNA polymerase specialized sigma24 family protein